MVERQKSVEWSGVEDSCFNHGVIQEQGQELILIIIRHCRCRPISFHFISSPCHHFTCQAAITMIMHLRLRSPEPNKLYLLTLLLIFSSTLPAQGGGGVHHLVLNQTPSSPAGGLDHVLLSRLLVDDDDDDDDENSTDGWGEEQGEGVVVLAPRRTYRKDPLKGFQRYTGGWNITNHHYWASVTYTAAPFFLIAGAWFLIFGLCLALCLCRRRSFQDNTPSIRLILFFAFFSIAAIVGCVVLYTGQQKFHSTSIRALEYVTHQADSTAANLRNVSQYLSAAKQINLDNNQVSLSPNIQADVDQTQTNIDSSASALAVTTRNTSHRIKHIIELVRLALFLLTAVLLLLTFLGLVLSIYGMQLPAYILVITGWILVTATFILCGTFLLLHNVAGDTCAAMNQWVQNPVVNQHTALDDVLKCLDNGTVQDTLSRTKQVTSELVDLINTVITNVSNINFSPNFGTMYYNQSGPLVPTLCKPETASGVPGEVDLYNATDVWSGYVCTINEKDICVTTGRLNPSLYSEMTATVNVSRGLYEYGPVAAQLEDGCSFVRQAFSDIGTAYCPALRTYSRRIYLGLLMLAIALVASLLLLLLIFGKEIRNEKKNKKIDLEYEIPSFQN